MAELSLSDWLVLIQAEYREIPGLHLTKWQIQHFWGLEPAMCDTLVETLERAKFLRRTPQNGYVWTSIGADDQASRARMGMFCG